MADTILTTIHGNRLGLSDKGALVATGPDGSVKRVTPPAVDASIVVGAENTNVRAITVTLKDANGAAITNIQSLDVLVFADAAGAALAATGGSTGIAIGANGNLLAVTAKKVFKAFTNASGVLSLTWTDTGTEAAYLGVLLPGGGLVISSALTNT